MGDGLSMEKLKVNFLFFFGRKMSIFWMERELENKSVERHQRRREKEVCVGLAKALIFFFSFQRKGSLELGINQRESERRRE